jgi:hypothetical protein
MILLLVLATTLCVSELLPFVTCVKGNGILHAVKSKFTKTKKTLKKKQRPKKHSVGIKT